MKTLLLVALAVGLAVVALAPTAEATNRCTALDSWCPGLVCYHNGSGWICVREPSCDPWWC